jgi:hypothetical protein
MATRLAVCTNRDYCSLGDRRLVLRLSEYEAFFCPECGRVLEPTTGGPPGMVVVLRALAVVALAGIAAASVAVLWLPHPATPVRHPRAVVAARAPSRLPIPAAAKPPAPPTQPPKPAPIPRKQPVLRPSAPMSVAVRLLVANTSPPPPQLLPQPVISPYALALTVMAPPELASSLVPKLLAGFLAAEGIKPRSEQQSSTVMNMRFGPDADREVIVAVARSSADALAALANNTADIALPDRPLTAPESAMLANAAGQTYATAATEVVVHLSNALPSLARRQVAAILDGRIANWSGLKRPNAPLHTYVAQDLATAGAMGFGAARLPVGRTLTALPDEAAVLHAVAADPQGVGFITSGMEGGVRPVPLEEAAQSALVRTLSAYAAPAAKPMASRFLAYLQTDDARRIEIGAGFAPPLPTPAALPAPPPKPPVAKQAISKPRVPKTAAAKGAVAQAPASKPVPPKALADPLPAPKPVVVATKPTVPIKPHPDSAKVTTNPASSSQEATVPPPVEAKGQALKASDKPPTTPAFVAAKPEPVPQSRPEVAKVAASAAPPASVPGSTQAATEVPHQRIVQLPPGSKFTFGPLKDVRMPTMITQRVGQPAHTGGDKAAQGAMQVDCAIDASGVPQDCKLLSSLHSGGVSESILSWLTSGAIRYPAKDANGQTGGRRVLTVKFPGQ